MTSPLIFATVVSSSTYGRAGEGILVGRMVANTAFIEAVARHGSFDRIRFYIGETADGAEVRKLFSATLGDKLEVRSIMELGSDFGAANFSVLHFGAHLDRFSDLVWMRDRYASRNIPITGQIHTLSYPRSTNDYLRFLLIHPRENDAILCSTESGKRVVENAIAGLRNALSAQSVELPALDCELPVIPLGIETAALQGGDGQKLRGELDIPSDAYCCLVLARFSEYDKMDIFPLLVAFRGAVAKLDRPAILLLAGARQGTKTPEMIQMWARALGIDKNLRYFVDFPEERKGDLLAAADVFVSPTDNVQETFGITVIEAMAAGVPPIVADFDGYRESVIEGVGLRIPTTWSPPSNELRDMGPLLYERPLHLLLGQALIVDLPALEAALLQLGRDHTLRDKLGKAARERAEEHYDWSRVIASYEELVLKLAAKPFKPGQNVSPDSPHPLALDFGQVFAHYPTEINSPERQLQVTEHGRSLCEAKVTPPIYPELANLFNEHMVAAVLIGAQSPVMANELAEVLVESFPGRALWHMEALLAWMQKHGLLCQVEN